MPIAYPIVFIFGAAIGSFLNVVILRSIKGWGLSGRSQCPHCNHTLGVPDLFPILSFTILGGKCRHCGAPISVQYPIVEFTAGLLCMITFPNVLLFSILCVLLVLFVIDLKTFLLPDFFIVLLGVLVVLQGNVSFHGMFIGAGFLLALWIITRGKGIGFGDVKLLIPIGFLAGIQGTVSILFASFLVGAIFGIVLIVTGLATRKSAIPFGPFLAGAAMVILTFPEIGELMWRILFPWLVVG